MVNLEELKKTVNSVKVLRGNPDFIMFFRYLEGLLESERTSLETAKPNIFQLGQGRIAAFREIIDVISNVDKVDEQLTAVIKGQSEESDPI